MSKIVRGYLTIGAILSIPIMVFDVNWGGMFGLSCCAGALALLWMDDSHDR